MSSKLTPGNDINSPQHKYQKTSIEVSGLNIQTGAPATGAVLMGVYVVAGFGDGTVRFFHPELPPVTVAAHSGVVLSVAADHEACLLYTSPSPRDQRGSRMPSSA